MLLEFWPVIVAALLPISELRGSIPIGIALGLDPWLVILVSIVFNALAFFPVYFALHFLYGSFFIRFGWARRLVERVRRNGEPYIKKYGIIGLAVFIGIPLPLTGLWTGTGIAWLMGLDWKKSFAAACLGVLIAGAIVSAVVLFGISVLGFFVG